MVLKRTIEKHGVFEVVNFSLVGVTTPEERAEFFEAFEKGMNNVSSFVGRSRKIESDCLENLKRLGFPSASAARLSKKKTAEVEDYLAALSRVYTVRDSYQRAIEDSSEANIEALACSCINLGLMAMRAAFQTYGEKHTAWRGKGSPKAAETKADATKRRNRIITDDAVEIYRSDPNAKYNDVIPSVKSLYEKRTGKPLAVTDDRIKRVLREAKKRALGSLAKKQGASGQ
ncbi:MAG: hypothetical protein LBE75_02220 [Burkholderiales bacterium]|jgi:hypothetical protein|nr:hypothetical protein [Burkholderiales bacterium]